MTESKSSTKPSEVELISWEAFNKKFSSDLVVLPFNTLAFGFHTSTGKFYLYRPGHILDAKNKERVDTILDFWVTQIHPFSSGKGRGEREGGEERGSYFFVFCVWDGWRERISFSPSKELRTYRAFPEDFKNLIEINPPPGFAPLLGSSVTIFSFSKHINDQTVTLIPDFEFLKNQGHKRFVDLVLSGKPWKERKAKFVWRGTLECGELQNFTKPHPSGLNPRKLFVEIVKRDRILGSFVDCDTSCRMEPDKMAEHKFIFDIDGFTNTFSGTVWKLASGSVLIKQESHWMQWYYPNLKPWIHYVPLKNDFSNLEEVMGWCLSHDSECEEIAKNAKKFYTERLTYERGKEAFLEVGKEFFSKL